MAGMHKRTILKASISDKKNPSNGMELGEMGKDPGRSTLPPGNETRFRALVIIVLLIMLAFIASDNDDSKGVLIENHKEHIDTGAVNVKGTIEKEDSDRMTDHVHVVHWIDSTSLFDVDYFSASWLAPLDTFLNFDTKEMLTSEDACHKVYVDHTSKIRMSTDWLDFSVEHMSKWWKILQAASKYHNGVSMDRIITNFLQYIKSTSTSTSTSTSEAPLPPLLQPTIAIIPFRSYIEGDSPISLKRSTNLTIASLGATIASLNRVGMGRIVVVGILDEDEALVRETFQLLKTEASSTTRTAEYQYVQVKRKEWYKTKYLDMNIPRAAVLGLQLAFNGHLPAEETKLWLGEVDVNVNVDIDVDPKHKQSHSQSSYSWKYVYLTEPDSILQTRIESLKPIRDALEKGMILMPHRFQPIPHETDLVGVGRNEYKYVHLTGKFADKPVLELNNRDYVCCDQGTHPKMLIKPCENFWYVCGFNAKHHSVAEHDELNKRLLPYDFIRLREGTNIVSVAGSEHGRMCRPEKASASAPGLVCKPPPKVTKKGWVYI